jgi:hypothetical protein
MLEGAMTTGSGLRSFLEAAALLSKVPLSVVSEAAPTGPGFTVAGVVAVVVVVVWANTWVAKNGRVNRIRIFIVISFYQKAKCIGGGAKKFMTVVSNIKGIGFL